MIRPVQNRPGEVIESGIEQIKRVASHLLDRPDFADQVAALGDQISPRLDFERQLVAQLGFQPLAAGVPELEVAVDVNVLLAFAIGSGQAAAGADRGDTATHFERCLFHR